MPPIEALFALSSPAAGCHSGAVHVSSLSLSEFSSTIDISGTDSSSNGSLSMSFSLSLLLRIQCSCSETKDEKSVMMIIVFNREHVPAKTARHLSTTTLENAPP